MKLNLGKGLVLAGVIFGLTPYAVFAEDAMAPATDAPAATTTTETTIETTTTTETAEPAKKAKKPAKKAKKSHKKKKQKKCDDKCDKSAEPVSALEVQEKTASVEPQASELAVPATPAAE